MSVGIEQRCPCFHTVSGKQYLPEKCPRCYGEGFYWDLRLNNAGDFAVVKDEEKLKQDIMKELATSRGDNIFYDIGHEIKGIVGKVFSEDFVEAFLRQNITRSLSIYRDLQRQQSEYQSVSGREFLSEIRGIFVEKVSGDTYRTLVSVVNGEGDQIEISIPVIV